MTAKQNQKYWRVWAQLLKCQPDIAKLNSAGKSEARHELHRRFGLPDSHAAWTNSEFSRWLTRTAPMCDQVDIRDRDRENAVWTIDRLRAAFVTLLGRDYAHNIMADWRDTTDLDNYPLQDASKLDLENLRNTLKNRLGRVIQRIKTGELTPGPDCPAFGDMSQADIITALIAGNAPQKPAKRKYTLHTPSAQPAKQFVARKTAPPVQFPTAPAEAAAQPKRKYCMHATPTNFKPVPQPEPEPYHAESDPF